MDEIESLYKREAGVVLIEIKLSSVIQLFNSFDPAPFYEKELDSAAEEYIVNIVDDFPADTPFRIIIFLPHELAGSPDASKIGPAIHNHFRYKMLAADQRFRSRFRFGRTALLIGLGFLALALFTRVIVFSYASDLAAQIFADALLIIGWAAMWEPVTVLLYQLWPIRQMKKIYAKISAIDIEIRPSA